MTTAALSTFKRKQHADVDIENYYGWQEFVKRAPMPLPNLVSIDHYKAFDQGQKAGYDAERKRYHASFGPLRSPTMELILREVLTLAVDNENARPGARYGAIIDGSGTLGKTTILQQLGRRFEKRAKRPARPVSKGVDHVHIPVIFISVPADTTPKSLLKKLIDFYGETYAERASIPLLTKKFKDAAQNHATRLVLLDDIHNLHRGNKSATSVNNLIKNLMNLVPATFVYAGINCRNSVLLVDDNTKDEENFSQTENRFYLYDVEPYEYDPHKKESEWLKLLRTLEQHVLLHDTKPGFLENEHTLLYLRTRGGIGALTSLVAKLANQAIRTGNETISSGDIEAVRMPFASQEYYRLTVKRLKEAEPSDLTELARVINGQDI